MRISFRLCLERRTTGRGNSEESLVNFHGEDYGDIPKEPPFDLWKDRMYQLGAISFSRDGTPESL